MKSRGEVTEQKILEAARKVFIEKGLAGARMQQIADEAGINKALLHYYFRNKDKLFERIFRDVFAVISKGVAEIFESQRPVFEKIEKFVDLYIDVFSENPYMPLFVLNEVSQNPERIKRLLNQGIVSPMSSFVTQLMMEINMGNIRPIHPIHLILNMLGMLVFPYVARPLISEVLAETVNVDYDDVLSERKQVIYDFIYNSLKIDNND